MALKFSTTEEQSVSNGVKFLVHAPAGYGKTDLIRTMPNALVLSAENGLLSLSQENQMRRYGNYINIPVIIIETYADMLEAYQFCKSSAHAKDYNPCLDSISEIAERVLEHAKRSAKDPRQAYGEMGGKVVSLIKDFRDLPGKHVYFSAKQDRDKDQNGMLLYGPSMPGKALMTGNLNISHFFDEVFALDISPADAQGQTYRYLRTKPNIQFSAKDRSGALLEIEKPDLGYIIEKIQRTT